MNRLKVLFIFILLPFLFGLLLVVSDQVLAANLNVNLEVTSDSTPPGGGGGPGVIPGCTDPGALNYNSNANTDDGSCLYPAVPNVVNFQATFNNTNNTVSLSWINPIFTGFEVVRVVRLINGVPTEPNDGLIVYEGQGQSFVDSDVSQSGTYFYVAFVRHTDGRYSSGSIAAAVVVISPDTEGPPPEIIPGCTDSGAVNYNPNANTNDGSCVYDPSLVPGCTDPVALNYNSNADVDDGSCLYPDPVDPTPPGVDPPPTTPPTTPTPGIDPFLSFPQALLVHPQIASLTLADFRFLQVGRPMQFFERGSRIYIDGSQDFTVMLPYDRVPPVLKTIGVTLYDPDGLTFSFLLRVNEAGTAYQATVGPLPKEGLYRVSIYVLNYEDQTMKKIDGFLQVSGFVPVTEAITTNFLSTLSIGAGLAAGTAQVVILTTGLISFLDLYLIFLRFLGQLAGLLGIRRRSRPWGVVYDSVTKRPIDPAYVSVFARSDQKEKANAITDIDGRYGFFLPSGNYYLTASKTNYAFPSKQLAGRKNDELYNNLYFGEEFEVAGDEVVNRNIPLDPIGFDWNEFAKSKAQFFKMYSQKEVRRARVLNTIFGLGFLFAAASVLVTPGWLNIGILFLYVAIYVFQILYRLNHKVVTLRLGGKEPVPFAIVRFFLDGTEQEVKHLVSDHLGRFFVLLRPGKYYFTVEERQADGSYKRIYHSGTVNMRKGVLTKDINIPTNLDSL